MDDLRPCPSCRRELPRLAFLSATIPCERRVRERETFLCAECHAVPAKRRAVTRKRLRAPLGFPCMSCSRVRPATDFDQLPGRVRQRVPTTCRECVDKVVAGLVRRGFAPERACGGECGQTLPLRDFVRAGRVDIDPRCPLCRLAISRAGRDKTLAKHGPRVSVKKRTDVDWHTRALDALYPGRTYDQLDFFDRTRVYLVCVEMMRDAQLWPAPQSSESPEEESSRLGMLYRLVARHDRLQGREPLADAIGAILRPDQTTLFQAAA